MFLPKLARGKPVVVLSLVAGLWSAGCCPEGTVTCRMTRINFVVDVENRVVRMERESYRTCVAPGDCPDPPSGNPTPGGPDPGPEEAVVDELLAELGFRVASGRLALGSRDVEFRLRSLRSEIGSVERADAVVRIIQRDKTGRVVNERVLRTDLDVASGSGGDWVLRPRTDPETRRFIKDAVWMLIEDGGRGLTTIEYTLAAQFDRLPLSTKSNDFFSDVRIAGIVIE